MAIPDFDDDGLLPPGIHPATLDEIERRFGLETVIRRNEMESLRWLVDLACQDDVRRILVDGSFTSDVLEPNDVDCVLLVGPDFGRRGVHPKQWKEAWSFLHFEVADQAVFDDYVSRIFAMSREYRFKGMIEVIP